MDIKGWVQSQGLNPNKIAEAIAGSVGETTAAVASRWQRLVNGQSGKGTIDKFERDLQALGHRLMIWPRSAGAEDYYLSLTDEMSRYELEELQSAINWRWFDIYVKRLQGAGFKAFSCYELGYVLVAHDSDAEPELATVPECQQLLDTVANLNPLDAWNRWIWKKAPVVNESLFLDAADARAIESSMVERFQASHYGDEFPQDKVHILRYCRELKRDSDRLKAQRRRMQVEFLQAHPPGFPPIHWEITVPAYMAKYDLSRNVTRDALTWAMQNREAIIPAFPDGVKRLAEWLQSHKCRNLTLISSKTNGEYCEEDDKRMAHPRHMSNRATLSFVIPQSSHGQPFFWEYQATKILATADLERVEASHFSEKYEFTVGGGQ